MMNPEGRLRDNSCSDFTQLAAEVVKRFGLPENKFNLPNGLHDGIETNVVRSESCSETFTFKPQPARDTSLRFNLIEK